MPRGLSAKIPLTISESFGPYDLHTDLKMMVRQNLKMLLLTVPGERMMDPDFGVGLYSFLHEMNTESLRSEITAKLNQQVEKYLDFIRIDSVSMVPDSVHHASSDNVLHLSIKYMIIPLSEEDILGITLPDFVL